MHFAARSLSENIAFARTSARAECAGKSKPALVFFADGERVARRTDKFGGWVATALLPARLHQEIR